MRQIGLKENDFTAPWPASIGIAEMLFSAFAKKTTPAGA
jgi:hypothetical protein